MYSGNKKAAREGGFSVPAIGGFRSLNLGRGDRIRTCDFYVPNVALYQAELHPAGAAHLNDGREAWQQFPHLARGRDGDCGWRGTIC